MNKFKIHINYYKIDVKFTAIIFFLCEMMTIITDGFEKASNGNRGLPSG